MASSTVATALVRRVVTSSKSAVAQFAGNRAFHSSRTKQMADHHGSDGSIYSNEYIHAPHMYDLPHMKNRRLKMGLMVFGGLSLGVGVPIYATHFQLKKSGM